MTTPVTPLEIQDHADVFEIQDTAVPVIEVIGDEPAPIQDSPIGPV